MGEIADLVIDGEICQECHRPLAFASGYPLTCEDCKRHGLGSDTPAIRRGRLKPVKNHECKICGKRFKKLIGLNAHHRDVHEANRKEASE